MGQFAKIAAPLLGWEEKLEEQKKRLGKAIPSSEEEATATAAANVKKYRELSHALGFALRSAQREKEGVEELLPQTDESLGVPGREVVISLPSLARPTDTLKKRAQEAVNITLRSSKPDEAYPAKQLELGKKVEKEHTDNPVAKKIISKDHLDESSKYYTRLKEMEKGLEQEKDAGLFSAISAPIGETMEDVKLKALQALDEQKSKLTRTTSDPSTLPWYYASLAGSVPKEFMAGFSEAERLGDEKRLKEITDKMESARADFERALSEEYRTSRAGVKAASAGEFLDGLAQVHVKSAEGELNQALGAYLALATLLGQTAHSSTYEWVSKRDKSRQTLSAFREAIKQRMRAQPSPVQVISPEIESENEV